MVLTVEVSGFAPDEERRVRDYLERFADRGYHLTELERVAKARLPGYNGLVTPRAVPGRARMATVMELAHPAPFTIAHELAHVSDIAVRDSETRDHMSGRHPTHWHLAHRLSSEYYANRVACGFCTEDEVFPAFQNDRVGMVAAARKGDWAHVLINYALLLGIFHGLGREDVEPLDLLPEPRRVPANVTGGIAAFRAQAAEFFAGYAAAEPA